VKICIVKSALGVATFFPSFSISSIRSLALFLLSVVTQILLHISLVGQFWGWLKVLEGGPERSSGRLVLEVSLFAPLVASCVGVYRDGDFVPVVDAAPVRVVVGLGVLRLGVPRGVEGLGCQNDVDLLSLFDALGLLGGERDLLR